MAAIRGASRSVIDVPTVLSHVDCVFENVMIDRDAVPAWQDGPVTLLGDAAHAMYPSGSNGASHCRRPRSRRGHQEAGVSQKAVQHCDGPISQLVLRNRSAGPFGLLSIVDARCNGAFDNIGDVIAPEERANSWLATRPSRGWRVTLSTAPHRPFPRGPACAHANRPFPRGPACAHAKRFSVQRAGAATVRTSPWPDTAAKCAGHSRLVS